MIHFQQHGYIPDKLKKAEKRIAQIAHDTEAWSVLIRDAQVKKTHCHLNIAVIMTLWILVMGICWIFINNDRIKSIM